MLLPEGGTEFKELTFGSSALHGALFFIVLFFSLGAQFFHTVLGKKGMFPVYWPLQA